jgi:nicotinate-nucleotide pyrophosphorylase (carboxylating)
MSDAARPACILETRKTAPALRLVDKWAVSILFLVLLMFTTFGFLILMLQICLLYVLM